MREKFLKDIVAHVAGPAAEGVVDLLYEKENVNEFNIAKKLNLTINQTRNILYKLSDEGLVSFIRKKDSKNGGWYTYFWTLDTEKGLSKLSEKIQHAIIQLEIELTNKMTKQFYFCPNGDMEISEEEALAHNFTCPECGEVFQRKDNEKEVNEIRGQIESSRKRLEEIRKEIAEITEKKDASKERKRKREEKKKKEKRAKERKERKDAKAKEAKMSSKKSPAKKIKSPKKKTSKPSKKSPKKKASSKKKTGKK